MYDNVVLPVDFRLDILVNFNTDSIDDGIFRKVNGY